MKYPVVYSYKKTDTRELELSIQSLHNIKEWDGRVFIIGDKPKLKADYAWLPIKYNWGKLSGVKSNDEVCAYLTAADFLKDYIVMADDQFILHPWSLEYYNRGSLQDHIDSRELKDNYTNLLINTQKYLQSQKLKDTSYEMHVPFLVSSSRIKIASNIIQDNKPMHIRSLIGNIYKIESTYMPDCKDIEITKDTVLYSSSNKTFNYDHVRSFLK